MAKTTGTVPSSARTSGRPRSQHMESFMSIEFLLVSCANECAVFADGNGVGFTNHVLMLPADEYTITVDEIPAPPSQDIVLSGTSLVRPMVVSFA